MMRDRFLCNILNEIDETYINEAIDVQQNRKKHNMFFIPIAASIAFFVLTGVLFLRKGSELHEGPIDMITAELEEHSFALMVYAAEDSTNMLKVNPEEAHEYIISSNMRKYLQITCCSIPSCRTPAVPSAARSLL